MLALTAVKAYQARRVKKLRDRFEKRRAALSQAKPGKSDGAPAE